MPFKSNHMQTSRNPPPLTPPHTQAVVDRLARTCPNLPPEDIASRPPQQQAAALQLLPGIAELIEQATSARTLSRMEATWHPWF